MRFLLRKLLFSSITMHLANLSFLTEVEDSVVVQVRLGLNQKVLEVLTAVKDLLLHLAFMGANPQAT